MITSQLAIPEIRPKSVNGIIVEVASLIYVLT